MKIANIKKIHMRGKVLENTKVPQPEHDHI